MMPDDPELKAAASAFAIVFPAGWYVTEERLGTVYAQVGTDHADDVYAAELPRPSTTADALRLATARALRGDPQPAA